MKVDQEWLLKSFDFSFIVQEKVRVFFIIWLTETEKENLLLKYSSNKSWNIEIVTKILCIWQVFKSYILSFFHNDLLWKNFQQRQEKCKSFEFLWHKTPARCIINSPPNCDTDTLSASLNLSKFNVSAYDEEEETRQT